MKNLLIITGAAAMLAATTTLAQTSSNSLPVWTGSTNYVGIGYASYRTDTKDWGWGGVGLYKVSPNFYAGLRYDATANEKNTAGVQANMQIPFKWGPVTVIPFWEVSTGLGTSQLYASTGPGGLIMLGNIDFKVFGHTCTFGGGPIADFEQVTTSSGKGHKQVNAGFAAQIKF